MIGGSLAFLAIAIVHPDPALHEDTWAVEPSLVAELHARRAAREAGWRLQVETWSGPGTVLVRARLRDGAGRAVQPERVWLHRDRPALAGHEADFELAPDAEGWTRRVPLPAPGGWRLTVRAQGGGRLALRQVSVRAAEEPSGRRAGRHLPRPDGVGGGG